MNRNDKILFFMHIHNSGTHNGDHLILLIMTGNAHKLPPKFLRNLKGWGGLKHNQANDGGYIMVVFTIKEINY